MIFRKKPKIEGQGDGLTISPVVAVIIIGLFSGCMVGAYLLGFNAGHTNGLELALANSVSQVVRNPISKSSLTEDGQGASDNSDVYSKLKESAQASSSVAAEISQEVKEFLKPTIAVDSKSSLSLSSSSSSSVNSIIIDKKKADAVAIERALKEAKQSEKLLQAEKTDKSVRVIGGSDQKTEKTTAKEDFSAPLPLATAIKATAQPTQQPRKEKPTIVSPTVAPVKQTAKPKPTPVTQETASAQSLPGGWYAQVAAPRSLKEAQAVAVKLQKSGFKAKIESAQVRDERYYRVVVGPESTRDSADRVLARLRKQTIIRTEPFIRMVR